MVFDRRGRLDMPADSFLVEVSTDNSNWEQAAGFSDLQLPWTKTYVQLDHWQGHQMYLRFRLKSDDKLGDLGIHFDNIRIQSGVDLDAPENPSPLPKEYRISKVYPNPFNPSTTIEYEAAGAGPVEFTIHNLLGQVVWSSVETPPSAGRYYFRWNGSSRSGQALPSGLYFLRLSHSGKPSNVHKLMLLK
ncbi:T9SS type A sorting domain-containing protein [bacterium]|nr:T9SS type A sorting domain-containing protein [bacterium]